MLRKTLIAIYLFTLLFQSCNKDPVITPVSGSFTDTRDQQEYSWVRIGDQVWMADNLAYLPDVSPVSDFSASEPYYYIYGYPGTSTIEAKLASNFIKFGVLYNWSAAKAACPAGWHLPDDDEWKKLETYLGMGKSEVDSSGFRESGSVGKKLKSVSSWDYNGIGDNSSGFSALPAGYRSYGGKFEGTGQGTGFWSASESNETAAWYRGLVFYSGNVHREFYSKTDGFSVRCLRD